MSIRNHLLFVGVVCIGVSYQGGAEKRAPGMPKPSFQRWSEKELVQEAWQRIQKSIREQKGDIEQVAVEYYLDSNGVLCSVNTKVYPVKYREKKLLTKEVLQDGRFSQVIKVRYAPGKEELCVRKGSTNILGFGGSTLVRTFSRSELQRQESLTKQQI